MIGRWRDLPAIYDEVVAAINAVPGTLAGSAHQSQAGFQVLRAVKAALDPKNLLNPGKLGLDA